MPRNIGSHGRAGPADTPTPPRVAETPQVRDAVAGLRRLGGRLPDADLLTAGDLKRAGVGPGVLRAWAIPEYGDAYVGGTYWRTEDVLALLEGGQS